MKHLLPVVALAAYPLLTACTFQANVPPSLGAAAAVMSNRTVSAPVSILYRIDPGELDRPIKTDGMACSAHSYAISASAAFKGTFDAVNAAAFHNIVSTGGQYEIVIEPEPVDVRLAFQQGFWSGSVTATAEVSAHASVRGAAGEIIRASLDGEGTGHADGGCPEGSQAIDDAVQKAIKHVAEQYADRIINSGEIK